MMVYLHKTGLQGHFYSKSEISLSLLVKGVGGHTPWQHFCIWPYHIDNVNYFLLLFILGYKRLLVSTHVSKSN